MADCDLSWINSSRDTRVTEEPAYLVCVIVTPDGTAGGADCTLYDGANALGKKVIRLNTTNNPSLHINFPPPGIRCDHGIFLDVGSNVVEVLVAFRPVQS